MPSPTILSSSTSFRPKIITISEKVWRSSASNHSNRIKSLLQPDLTPPPPPPPPPKPSKKHSKNNNSKQHRPGRYAEDGWTSLDPINPIYNFLIEYYGLKGAKGPRRLARWSPNPILLLLNDDDDDNVNDDCDPSSSSMQQSILSPENAAYNAAMGASHGLGGIFLENAQLKDLGGTLHLRGGVPVPMEVEGTTSSTQEQLLSNSSSDSSVIGEEEEEIPLHGVLYNPAVFYNRHIQPTEYKEHKKQLLKTMAPFQWFTSILQTTLASDPILHCYGLHEWAMQYHPEGAAPPPSAKYQSSLDLRVSQGVINETVERKGIRCTHVDALRFFAPAAGPLNHHGASLERTDQLRLEQKGCVHAHMDLLKIALKLKSFVDPNLISDVLEISLAARTLDVAASPYDATGYGAGVVPVETAEGRKLYREEQIELMKRAEPVRKRLLAAYKGFMKLAFDEDLLVVGDKSSDKSRMERRDDTTQSSEGPYIAPERLATAQPGGLPWRRNLIE